MPAYVFACIFFSVCGILLLVMTSNLEEKYQECYKDVSDVTIALVVASIIFFCTNLVIIFQNKMDPRVRRRVKKIILPMRIIEIGMNIPLIFTICFRWNPFIATCHNTHDIFYRLYLGPYVILAGFELSFIAIVILTVILCGVFGCCKDPQLQEGNIEGGPEPGKPYVEEKTEVYTFQKLLEQLNLKEEEDEDMKCAICFDEYKEEHLLRKMPCDHFFHKDCIDQWMEKMATCPICNQDIRTAQSKFATDPILDPSSNPIDPPSDPILDPESNPPSDPILDPSSNPIDPPSDTIQPIDPNISVEIEGK